LLNATSLLSQIVDPITAFVRPAAAAPEGALVLLHGRGANEHDLVPLMDRLDPGARLVGVTARAPLALPPGGRHWYVVRELGYPDPATFLPTVEAAGAWLDSLPEQLGVPLHRTVLGGFSQGCVMSWALSLGQGRLRPAGVIALSGFMPRADGFEYDLTGLDGFPVAIGHGSLDPVIGVEWGRQARDAVTVAGASVLYHESPVGHTIDPVLIPRLIEWLGAIV
jgi:phospholipase/carboxylesterase